VNELLALVQLYEARGGRLAAMSLAEFQLAKSRLWIVV
jgi:hypothetical protein